MNHISPGNYNRPPHPDMRAAAHGYGQRGWLVIPIHTRGKHPHTAHGVKDATTDEATIQQWWTRWPEANIGIATGAVSGIVAFDVDSQHGGNQSLGQLLQAHASPLPTTPINLTGSGGGQFLFAHPGQPVPNKVGLRPGLDIRGDGGYIVVPPSLHLSGRRYAWHPTAHPDTMALAPVPPWLLALITAPASQRGLLPSIGDSAPRIPAGQRNTTLASLAGFMRRGGFSLEAMTAALLIINEDQCDPPLDQAEVCRIATSIARYDAAVSLIPQASSTDPSGIEHFTDLGNAKRLVAHHGLDLHYCYPWRQWLVWDRAQWQIDDTGEVIRRAKDTVGRIYLEALHVSDPDMRQLVLGHARNSEAAPRLRAMLDLAASELPLPLLPAALDTDPWLFNIQNGTLDLRTGTLRPPAREDLITRLAPVSYDPDATCPQWDAFLQQIMAGNTALITFLQQAIGYALTGDVREQVLIILYGTGANGKSTFLNTLLALLGPYAMKATPELLMATRGDRHPTERADLCGKRFVAATETAESQRLNEVFVKEATGSDPIRARRMHEDFWEFWPTHKIFLATNHKPVIKGTDTGIWRRLRLVPFLVTIPDAAQDKTLPARLQAELPGILTWAVQGCLAWQREGLSMPDEVRQATQTYRDEMDILGRFLAERCILDSTQQVTTEALYQAYCAWCHDSGEYTPSKNYFSMRLHDRGFRAARLGNARGYHGIALAPEPGSQDAMLARLRAIQEQEQKDSGA